MFTPKYCCLHTLCTTWLQTDVFKGSYYANPEVDVPVEDENVQKQYPFYCTPNIWPKEDLPELEPAFKTMGQLVVSVGLLVAKQCDRYIEKHCPSTTTKLYNTISQSKNTKSRLLYYYPRSEEDTKEQEVETDDGWCGLHLGKF